MALINKEERNLSIKRQCELLDLPRSSYYYNPAKESEQNLLLMRQIDELHLKYPFYGVMRIRAALSKPEYPLSNKRIRRLMRKMAIECLFQLKRIPRFHSKSIVHTSENGKPSPLATSA